jgi:hypothetical protein
MAMFQELSLMNRFALFIFLALSYKYFSKGRLISIENHRLLVAFT